MSKKFRLTLDITTKDDLSISEIQRLFRRICFENKKIESFGVKTETNLKEPKNTWFFFCCFVSHKEKIKNLL